MENPKRTKRLAASEIFTEEVYRRRLIRLKLAVQENLPEWENRHNKLMISLVKTYLEGQDWEVLYHAPYAPDITLIPVVAVSSLRCHVLNLVLGAQDFYWRDYAHGVVPHDAFEGKTGIYVGQVYYSGRGLLPATIYPHRNAAVAIYGTRQDIKEHIKILCSPDTSKFYWETVDFAKGDISQMRNAVRGGFQDNQSLYVGLINHEGDWKIGKVKDFDRNDEQGLYVWDKTKNHVKIVNFQLLKYNLTVLPDFPFDLPSSKISTGGIILMV
ncbi:hypothetical protein Trydic_g1647 [Trypoxylus dichotomus]